MIRPDRKTAAGIALGLLIAAGLTAGLRPAPPADDPALIPLLDALSKKIDSYPDLDRWEAVSTTIRTRMNKSWEPEKITRIRKTVRVEGQDRQETVLEASETEKGITRDITAKMSKTYEDRARKEREEKASHKDTKSKDGDRRAITLTKKDFAPFGPGERTGYEFKRLEDAVVEGLPAMVIETHAKVRKTENIEGRYYFDRDTLDVLKVDLQPSKTPAFVKFVEMEVEFMPVQGALAMKRTRIKVHAGFLFKIIRLVIEEEYSDFRFLTAPVASS
jgi:hypothetical protein